MKSTFAAGAVLALLAATPAGAADLSHRMPVKAPIAPPPLTWTGCHVGVHSGYGWSASDWSGAPPADTNPKGFVGGAQLGCDYQMSNWVIGLSGAWSWADMHDNPIVSDGLSSAEFSSRTRWIATATARAGFAWDRALIYATGGAAFANNKYDFTGLTGIPAGAVGSATETRAGWVAGGGLEYALAPNWSAALEYNYMDLGTKTVQLTGNGIFLPTDIKQTIQTVTLGLNYRFY
ncbi:MAG TPA: outer membrane protein [Pseudolabrys sp.]|nr:outer membrane protein [Pseudolabrys sp.]